MLILYQNNEMRMRIGKNSIKDKYNINHFVKLNLKYNF